MRTLAPGRPIFVHHGNSRTILLAGASLAALALVGAPGRARAACVPSLQTLSGPTAGPVVSNGGAIVVTASGAVTGHPDGVEALACPITALTVQTGGTIQAGVTAAGAGGVGIFSAKTITTLTNGGAIAGGNSASTSFAAGAGGAGLSNAGTIVTLTNNGAIGGGNGGGASFNAGAGGWDCRTPARSAR